jgi:hypothetical protein
MLSRWLKDVPTVVIGDLVLSTEASDRAGLQTVLAGAVAVANEHCSPTYPLTPTAGDEFQGAFARPVDALRATVLVRASMSVPHDVRFGVGVGKVYPVGDGGGGFPLQDGPGWWAARDAIAFVASGGFRRGVPQTLRTWVGVAAPGMKRERRPVDRLRSVEHAADPEVRALNAYLATRDHLVSQMDDRDRRILRDLLLGGTITRTAEREGISVSAVSQRTQRSGAATVAFSLDVLAGAAG